MTKKSKILWSIMAGTTPLILAPTLMATRCGEPKPHPAPKPNTPNTEPTINNALKYKSIEEYNNRIKSLSDEIDLINTAITDKTKAIETLNEELDDFKYDDSKTEEEIANKTNEVNAEIEKLDKEISEKKSILNTKTQEFEKADSKKHEILAEIAFSKDGSEKGKKFTAEYIISLKDLYAKDLTKAGLDQWNPAPSKEDSIKITQLIDKYIENIKKVNTFNLTSDSIAWANGLKFNWEIEKENYDKGLRYLLGSFNWGPSDTYPANGFYGSIIASVNDEPSLYKQWKATLKEAIELGLVPSKVWIKSNINAFIKDYYADKLAEFYRSEKTSITLKALINYDENATKPFYMSENDWEIRQAIDEFYDFYITDYYNASSYGLGENINNLTIYKTNDIHEIENTMEVNVDGTYQNIYGLGYTEKDLNETKVGIGFMPGKEGGLTGEDLYKQLLKMSTSTELTPQQIYDEGYKQTKEASANMKKIAIEIAKLITGDDNSEWSPTIKYDEDGIGSKAIVNLQLHIRDNQGNINLTEFYKWLNAEDFFFGREDASYYTEALKSSLKEDKNLADSRSNLTKLDYDHLFGDDNKNEAYGSITNEQFYYGALEAFKAYKQFKATTQKYGASYFPKEVPDYGIDTYEFARRANEGVGAYEGSKEGFFFNVDPYYSVPKWALTTFANHESMMGHHNQIQYAKHNLTSIDGLKLGDIFNYTSYIEGWAVFTEWFAIEAGFYGTPDYNNKDNDYYAMPIDFSLSKGITSFITSTEDSAITEDIIKQMKELHGGVYWQKVASVRSYSDDKQHTRDAAKLANMLQYFGALTEAQLRNMRLALDVSYHSPSVKGHDDLITGHSIIQTREFMKLNSALGTGDIASESRRYLSLPAQATAYNSGKKVMLDLYKKVQNHLGLSREEFVNASDGDVKHVHIKKLYDMFLRNGGLPMSALEEVIKNEYKIK
ncbi:DUF885 family protein [Metamycoplasma cloacale]|uniref:DUF885 family protein n=1 Tax=Metamycoplasma cloacale TaxID=92401 RepID=UPI0006910D8D|nr:DUF885 family protein [Metamycoplasma cloacale]